MQSASDEVLREILALEEAHKVLGIRDRAQDDFMTFVKHVYEGFIEGSHHKQVAKKTKHTHAQTKKTKKTNKMKKMKQKKKQKRTLNTTNTNNHTHT